MSNSNPLLAQVALTVSPFVSLPAATTLPYTYRSLPTNLPPPSTADRSGAGNPGNSGKPAFVVSSSGQAAHPSDIQTSCQKLQAHLQQTRDESIQTFREWETGIKQRELAEKRRVAPGWLDRDEKILRPEKTAAPSPALTSDSTAKTPASSTPVNTAEGEELDRAFGALGMR